MLEYNKNLDSAYDQNEFYGRLRHFQELINPSNLFKTNDQILEYKRQLENLPLDHKYSNKELWQMKYSCLSNLHPDNQQPITKIFRVSSFVPVNIPIIIGLGMIAPTPINQLISQSINQSYNFGFNYANRNLSNSFSFQEMTFALLGSLFFACSASIGAQNYIRKSNYLYKNQILKISPVFGIISANTFNLFLSRYKDFINGIQVKNFDTKQDIEGNSQIAAKIAFQQSAFMRVMLPVTVIGIPYIFISGLERFNLMPTKNPKLIIVNTCIAAITCYICLGSCLAYFPQNTKIHKSLLEKNFQNIKDLNGQSVEYFEFNKGL